MGKNPVARLSNHFKSRFLSAASASDIIVEGKLAKNVHEACVPVYASAAAPPVPAAANPQLGAFLKKNIQATGQGMEQRFMKLLDSLLVTVDEKSFLHMSFDHQVHPFATHSTTNPEIAQELPALQIAPAHLNTIWPVTTSKPMTSRKSAAILTRSQMQELFDFFRHSDTYGDTETLRLLALLRNPGTLRLPAQQAVAQRLLEQSRMADITTQNRFRTRLAAINGKIADIRAQMTDFKTSHPHLCIARSGIHLFNRVRVNGMNIDADGVDAVRGDRRFVITVPFIVDTAVDDGENAPANMVDSVGSVEFFVTVLTQSSGATAIGALRNKDRRCTCPDECSSTSNLSPAEARQWTLAYVAWYVGE